MAANGLLRDAKNVLSSFSDYVRKKFRATLEARTETRGRGMSHVASLLQLNLRCAPTHLRFQLNEKYLERRVSDYKFAKTKKKYQKQRRHALTASTPPAPTCLGPPRASGQQPLHGRRKRSRRTTKTGHLKRYRPWI
jgi:hypothetical protein